MRRCWPRCWPPPDQQLAAEQAETQVLASAAGGARPDQGAMSAGAKPLEPLTADEREAHAGSDRNRAGRASRGDAPS